MRSGFAALVLLVTACAAAGGGGGRVEGVQTFDVPSRDHVQGEVEYPQDPPVGGPHFPVPQNCGFYSAPVPSETAVHSMEHGAVWITFQPDLPQDQVDALRQLAQQPYILVTPYDGLVAPVVASAWGVQLQLDSVGDPALVEFVQTYREGPQAPEPGAPCEGGVGTPG